AETGNPAFDDRFVVVTAGGDLLRPLLTPEVQQRIAARDDWAIWLQDTYLVSIAKGRFNAGYEMGQQVAQTRAMVARPPASVVPRQVDPSVDDLLVRINRLNSVEDALAFLRTLTPDERGRLARSNTPLAAFADVRSPAEAMVRLEAMDMASRM